MDIMQLEGKRVKVCPRSIKAMDNAGKTCGVVTGITRFKDAPGREQIEHFSAIRSAGLWGCRIDGIIDNVIIAGQKLYYLNDVRPLDNFKLFSGTLSESERLRYEKRLALAEKAGQYMTVINVYCV